MRTEEAEKQFVRSVSIAPNVVAFDSLGEIYRERKAFAAAERMFSRSIALNPEDVKARTRLAEIYAAHAQPAMAAAQYRAILKFDPKNAEAREGLQKLAGAAASRPDERQH